MAARLATAWLAHGDLAVQLYGAIGQLPAGVYTAQTSAVGVLERVPAPLPPVWCKKSAVYTQLKLCLLGSHLTDPKSPLLGWGRDHSDSLARSRMS